MTTQTVGHTPGPWTYRTCYTSGEPVEFAVESIHPEHGGPLATVHLTVDNDEQDEANARLVAAAPDLVAALVGLVQWHVTDYDGLGEERGCDGAYLRTADRAILLEAADAALAKAKA